MTEWRYLHTATILYTERKKNDIFTKKKKKKDIQVPLCFRRAEEEAGWLGRSRDTSLVEQPSIKESSPLSSDLSEAVSCASSKEKKGKDDDSSSGFIFIRISSTSLTKHLKSPALLHHPSSTPTQMEATHKIVCAALHWLVISPAYQCGH